MLFIEPIISDARVFCTDMMVSMNQNYYKGRDEKNKKTWKRRRRLLQIMTITRHERIGVLSVQLYI